MVTTKELGCGGRYSAYQFVPCRICPITKERMCSRTQKRCGTAHYEWFTDLTGRAKWRATRLAKEETQIVTEG